MGEIGVAGLDDAPHRALDVRVRLEVGRQARQRQVVAVEPARRDVVVRAVVALDIFGRARRILPQPRLEALADLLRRLVRRGGRVRVDDLLLVDLAVTLMERLLSTASSSSSGERSSVPKSAVFERRKRAWSPRRSSAPWSAS
jgi:hypothetical protein